jgi:hypothetical protein
LGAASLFVGSKDALAQFLTDDITVEVDLARAPFEAVADEVLQRLWETQTSAAGDLSKP